MGTRHRSQVAFVQGWSWALEAIQKALDVPDGHLNSDQEEMRQIVLKVVDSFVPDEDLLKPTPTNAELARKYLVSPRTITNWRKAGCPFEESQWRVLDWVAEQRIIPAGANAKFAKQLERRRDKMASMDDLDELAKIRVTGKILLKQARIAKRLGLL